jgi:glyoxylase-like metal-dependent hydrolase (beta-lactamase superfamily II)
MAHLRGAHRVAAPSRRDFLKATVASATAVSCSSAWRPAHCAAAAEPATGTITQVSEHLLIYHGAVNIGIVRDGDRAILIDCGDEAIGDALRQLGIARVDQVLLTHYHRDQACGIASLPKPAAVAVGAEERELCEHPAKYWNDDNQLYRVYVSYRPDHLTPVEPLPVARSLQDGDTCTLGPATIRVIATPGHTDGSLSFLVDVDGQCTVLSGDCIAGPGQIWDVYSLQRGFAKNGQEIGGYHGFMGDRWRLAESLAKIKNLAPRLIVPSHGALMHDPAGAVDALLAALETCYENYVSISALRHYFPKLFTDYEGRPGQMPIRPGIKPPACLRHFGTTWMLVSAEGGAFVMDVGGPDVVDRLKKMQADGEIKQVEGLWITHYHFDHTDGVLAFQKAFDCPCYTDARLADVLTRPAAWRLPCLAPDVIRVHRPMNDGETWQWREFTLTSHFFPGQTLYHSGLLAATPDLRMLFVGDSHTMSGLDDYCAHNRNWLGRGVGFQHCLTLIERLKPTHMFNCHVDDAFTFTPDEIQFMRAQLDEREQLFGRLVPWEHANFGQDPLWVRTDPYRQPARAGSDVQVKIVITNHSTAPATYACRAVLPTALGGSATEWIEATVPPKKEQDFPLSLALPTNVPHGRYVVPLDVRGPARLLPRFSELIVDVG